MIRELMDNRMIIVIVGESGVDVLGANRRQLESQLRDMEEEDRMQYQNESDQEEERKTGKSMS